MAVALCGRDNHPLLEGSSGSIINNFDKKNDINDIFIISLYICLSLVSGCCTVWQGQPSSAGMKYAQPQFLDKVLQYGSTAVVNINSLIYVLVLVSF